MLSKYSKNKRSYKKSNKPKLKKSKLTKKSKKSKRSKRTYKKNSKKYCQSKVSQKISINMKEMKSGNKKIKSPSQAIAIAYSQIRKKHPKCSRFLRKN
jgi:hypothetical protein